MNHRLLLLLLLLLPALPGSAQRPSTSSCFANAYTYTDADGATSFNNTCFQLFPSGLIYSAAYGLPEPAVLGNNFVRYLPCLRQVAARPVAFRPGLPGTDWYVTNALIAVVQGDTVARTFPLHPATECSAGYRDGLILFNPQDSLHTQLQYFDGRTLRSLDWSRHMTAGLMSVLSAADGTLWASASAGHRLHLYRIDRKTLLPVFVKTYAITPAQDYLSGIRDADQFVIGGNRDHQMAVCRHGSMYPAQQAAGQVFFNHPDLYPWSVRATGNNRFRISYLPDTTLAPVSFEERQVISAGPYRERNYGSFIYCTGNKPVRLFPCIRKYPRLFDGNNSASIFTVREDDRGRIWAGSYAGGLSIVEGEQVTQLPLRGIPWMNGGTSYHGRMYLIGEGNTGIQAFDAAGHHRRIPWEGTGFYSYLSRDQRYCYFSKHSYMGLWRCTTGSLEQGRPVWEKLDSSRGVGLENILTITEDTTGRIWFGHPRYGIGVYDPEQRLARSWNIRKDGASFGASASLTDTWGTVWMGGNQGLWHYSDYARLGTAQSFQLLRHPLLQTVKSITGLTICRDWLVIAAYDKILALDLKAFHENGRILLRYLNPQESAFTSFTEQNTLITARDSSVWFSTSDMLYHWDFGHWLQLPRYKASVTIRVTASTGNRLLAAGQKQDFDPGSGSFDLKVELLSPDAMPRYLQAGFVRDGDTAALPPPSLQSTFPVRNTAAGRYTFYLNVFEQDGTISRYEYPVVIHPFFWQTWWFWAGCTALALVILAYVFHTRKQQGIAQQEARRKAAELEAYRSEQEKKLADLRLITLSNQFRPHFILNALNTIGAKMHDRPDMESVLSRLGESVNLIFNHARSREVAHPFRDEWALVYSLIQIHKLMYLKTLETILPDEAALAMAGPVEVPMGILQIPVENALLHGLNNRQEGPWQLEIRLDQQAEELIVRITDNGVGRRKAGQLSNATRHGTGTRNQEEIIAILNQNQTKPITFRYEDEVFGPDGDRFGTRYIVHIPLHFSYASGA